MDLKIKDRVAIVTGSTTGIGKAIARTLAEEGATVIINGRKPESVDAAVKELAGVGSVHGVAADVATEEGAVKLAAEAEKHGPVDILVNNTGIFEPKQFEEITDDEWRRFFEINVLSGVRLARLVTPRMRERGWGRIVFISSESGMNTPPEMIHYGTTKTAQLAVSRGLAVHLAGTGVTVNTVLPGPTWTEGVADFVVKMAKDAGISAEQMREEFVPRNRPTSIIERFAQPEEVASLVAYVCSDLASATTGAALRCEGGIVNACF